MIELYNNLMALVDGTKFFYTDDRSLSGTSYRIFSYNYASYNDWLQDGALECRGIMFEMGEQGPVRIAARPMEKFFNLGETPFTMGLDLTEVEYLLAKEDGSLVSSFWDNGLVRFKSKGSLKSEQAYMSTALLTGLEHQELSARLEQLAKDGFTANFEYVAPTNRIVLAYQEKQLILLNVRENDTGEYISYEEIYKDPVLRKYLVNQYEVPEGDWVKDIRESEGIEGFIAVMSNGLRFKLKTNWYVALHGTKDSISTPEKLFNAILAGASDDLKGLFADDEYSITKINAFETAYLNYLTTAVKTCNDVYQSLRGKPRKDYAISAQTLTKAGNPFLFTIIMNMYDGRMAPEDIVDQANKLFLKNFKLFVPKDY